MKPYLRIRVLPRSLRPGGLTPTVPIRDWSRTNNLSSDFSSANKVIPGTGTPPETSHTHPCRNKPETISRRRTVMKRGVSDLVHRLLSLLQKWRIPFYFTPSETPHPYPTHSTRSDSKVNKPWTHHINEVRERESRNSETCSTR